MRHSSKTSRPRVRSGNELITWPGLMLRKHNSHGAARLKVTITTTVAGKESFDVFGFVNQFDRAGFAPAAYTGNKNFTWGSMADQTKATTLDAKKDWTLTMESDIMWTRSSQGSRSPSTGSTKSGRSSSPNRVRLFWPPRV